MQLTIFAGKGGVGKTTSAVAYALKCSQTARTVIADYDGGHSTRQALGMREKFFTKNTLHQVNDRLMLAVIECFEFKGIGYFKDVKVKNYFDDYISQFPADRGIISFTEMINEFFGVPTDIETVQKFILLVEILFDANSKGYEHAVLDVEPTAGFERLLSFSDSMIRSLNNLKNKSWAIKQAVRIGWPDIHQYLESDYVQTIEYYTHRIRNVVDLLKERGTSLSPLRSAAR
ncbi:MAG: ArsA-related P-loop ATPase [bacterium]